MFESRFSFSDFSDDDDLSGSCERHVYDAYGTGEHQPGHWRRQFEVDALEGETYQFQGHREEAAPHREATETTAPAATSSESSAPSFLNFQIRAFHPKSAPWMSQEPADYVDGMNAYLFSRGDLVNPIKPL